MAVSGIEVFYVVFVAMESGFPEAIAETLAKLNLGIMSSAFAFFAVPAGWLGARFGSKRIMIIGLLLTGFAVSGIMSAGSPVTSRGYFAIAGVGMAMVGINSYPAVMDMANQHKMVLLRLSTYLPLNCLPHISSIDRILHLT